MNTKIKLGAVAWGLPGGGAFSPLVAHMAGLDGIQLELGSYKDGYPLAQPEVQKGYLDSATKFGLEYPAIVLNDVMEHPYIYGNHTPEGKIAWEQIELGVNVASHLGISRIMIPNFEKNLICEVDHILNTIQALQYACDLAAKKGICILTENSLSWQEQEKMLYQINRPNIKVHFDTQNFKFNCNYDQCEQLEHMYPLLDIQLHVKDGISLPGEKLLGEGNTDFFLQMKILKDKGFSGWIIIENYYNLLPLRKESSDNHQFELLKKDMKTITSCF